MISVTDTVKTISLLQDYFYRYFSDQTPVEQSDMKMQSLTIKKNLTLDLTSYRRKRLSVRNVESIR